MAKRTRIYRAHPHASFGDEVAQWIGLQIESHQGEITPEELVELSKPKAAPTHDQFIWNDAEAAEANRRDTAVRLLRLVEIEIVSEGNKQSVRACFPVFHEDSGEGAYRSHVSYDRIRESPDLARQVVTKASLELKSWRRRYALYESVFGPVFQVVDKLEKTKWQPQQSIASTKTATRKTAQQRKPIRKAK